jgi:hemoglobin
MVWYILHIYKMGITMSLRSLYCAVVLCLPGVLVAQAQPTATITARDLDARVDNQLFEVLKLGTDIYNRGAHESCYRLYQGSLMSLIGFLEHRPEHVTRIKEAFKRIDVMTTPGERAHALREVIDDLRAAIKLTHGPKPMENPTRTATVENSKTNVPQPVSLWKRLGNDESMRPIVNTWIDRALVNPRVNFSRRGTGLEWEANPENVTRIKGQFLAWLRSIAGEPVPYTGKDMKTAHARMKIADAEFDALVDDLRLTMERMFVSPFERNELLKLIDDRRKEIVDPTVMVRSLWERLGGEATVTLVVEDFVLRVSRNPGINFSRKGVGKEWTGTPQQVATLRKQLVNYISSATGGPLKYDGKTMLEAHTGMKITEAEFNALVADLKASLALQKVPTKEQDELLGLLAKVKGEVVGR